MGDDQQNCSVPWLLAVITINNNNNIPAPSRAIITRGFNITCDVRLYLISNALQWVQQWLAARGRSLQLLLLQYTHQQSSPSSLQQEKCDWAHMSILRTGEQNPARSGGSEDQWGGEKIRARNVTSSPSLAQGEPQPTDFLTTASTSKYIHRPDRESIICKCCAFFI